MSQKAWMNAYTKGSKSLQDRLAQVHKNNPEFQDFVKKHGFGGNLSVKQSGKQKTSVATVKPTTNSSPERNTNLGREAIIKAAAEKIKNRRQANANRVAFGGELGGSFSMPGGGFRRYSEALDYKGLKRLAKPASKAEKAELKTPEDRERFERVRKRFTKRANIAYLAGKKVEEGTINELSKDRLKKYVKGALRNMNDLDDQGGGNFKKTVKRAVGVHRAKRRLQGEDIAYKDGSIAMYRGGWIAKRGGKQLGTNVPSKEHARALIDNTRKGLADKLRDVLSLKKRKLATESAANRRRIRSPDSAILKDRNDPPFTPDKPKKLDVIVGKKGLGHAKSHQLARLGLKKQMERDRINRTIDYISNPKYSILDKNHINSLLKGK
jgi:hypothetical protein